ncbi:MAG: glycosyltransferase family 9 protein [Pseudomonadota bacterium]|nr:glycosyltransferase family 9 protein [Pseudomonadota bacterium]
MNHVLLIRPGALGDAIVTLPAVRALLAGGVRHVTILGKKSSWEFLRSDIERVHVIDIEKEQWRPLFEDNSRFGMAATHLLQTVDTAIVVLSTYLPHAHAALEQMGVPKILNAVKPRIEDYATSRSEGLDRTDSNMLEEQHAVVRLLEPVRHLLGTWHPGPLNVAEPSLMNDPFIRIDDAEIEKAVRSIGFDTVPEEGFVMIHPGASSKAKCWTPHGFADLAASISFQMGLIPVMVYGPAENNLRSQIEVILPANIKVKSLDNRPLRELLALMSIADAYIGNDSGGAHMAARACPTMVLFGPTDPRVWHPLGESVYIIRSAPHPLHAMPPAAVVNNFMNFYDSI